MREIRRWNPVDAEAYEEYGQLMVEMARFIKPILSLVPPDLTGMDPRQFAPLGGLLRIALPLFGHQIAQIRTPSSLKPVRVR